MVFQLDNLDAVCLGRWILKWILDLWILGQFLKDTIKKEKRS